MNKQETMAEILRCGKDPAYFCTGYAKISHPLRGLIPFDLYDFQKDSLKEFNKNRFSVILKARQLGISTITAAYVSWMMLFHKDKNVLVMATKFGTAANLVKKVKAIVKMMAGQLKGKTVRPTEMASTLENVFLSTKREEEEQG